MDAMLLNGCTSTRSSDEGRDALSERSRINHELKRLKAQIAALAGTTELEPAPSDVTGRRLTRTAKRISLYFQFVARIAKPYVSGRYSTCYSFRRPLYASSGIQWRLCP